MANNTKQDVLKGTTKSGVLIYPYLNKPDDVGGKARPAFKTSLRLSESDAKDLVKTFSKAVDDSYDAAVAELNDKISNGKDGKTKAAAKKSLEALTKNYPYFDDVDDEGDPTGDVVFKFKSNASYDDKKTGQERKLTIGLFDAKLKPTKAVVGGGSTARIAYIVAPYYMPSTNSVGISLRISGVQILDLVAPGAGGGLSGSAFGFSAEEGFDGSTVSDSDDELDNENESEGSDSNGDEDDDF